MDKITEGGEKWGKGVAVVAAALIGLKLTKMALFTKMVPNIVKGLFKMPGAIKMITSSLGSLGTAGAIVGAAMAGWAIGKGIYKGLEILGEKVPWVGKLYEDAGMKAAKFYNSAMGKTSHINKENEKKLDIIKKSERYQALSRIREMAEGEAKEKALAGYREKYKVKDIAKERAKTAAGVKTPSSNVEDEKDALQEETTDYEEVVEELGKFIKKTGEIRQQQFSTMSAVIERMKISGQIDVGELSGMRSQYLSVLDAEVAAAQKHNQALLKMKQARDSGVISGKMQVKDAGRILGLSEDQLKILEDQNWANVNQLADTAKILTNEELIASAAKKKLDMAEALAAVYDSHIRQTGLMAEEAGLLVQLADSYAIGVGASAQMRMREFNAIDKNIDNLIQKQRVYMAELADETSQDRRLELANKIQEIENQKTQEMIKQAGITKSLRDGWIEAIGSMNTGAGTFSKIVLDQNKGTAQSLKLAGQAAVISSRSGALGGGYRTSEKFSAMQGVAGQSLITGAMGKRTQAYQTTMDRITGTSAEGVQWKGRGAFQRDLAARNRAAASGGLTATAFGASPHYEGVAGEYGVGTKSYSSPASRAAFEEQPTMNNGGNTINVNVRLSGNAEQVSSEIAKKIGPEVKRIVNDAAAGSLDTVQSFR